LSETDKNASDSLHQLRKDSYQVLLELETENVVATPKSEELEDITDLVFGALEHLNDCELLCNSTFDLNETMSAFEAMD
jgi:hypothetical protein